jgi:uncharacterized membrane protein
VSIVAGIVIAVFLVILLIQAISGLTGRRPYPGENYFGQPVGSALMLVFVIAVAACLVLRLVFRKRLGKRRDRRGSRGTTFIAGKVPERFPWE